MATKNSLFRIMKSAAGGALNGLVGLIPGSDAIAGEIAAFVTAFQDSSGNAAVPQLDATGAVPVSFDSGTCKKSGAGSLAGTTTLTDITNSSVTLSNSKIYSKVYGVVSSMTESCFQLVWDDNGTENVLAEFQVGPGQYTFPIALPCLQFTTGATGTQTLKVKGANATADEVADLKAYIETVEAP